MHDLILLTALELFQPLKSELQELERGVLVRNITTKEDIIVVAPVLLVKCDNPRAAELLGQMGGNANKICRICKGVNCYI